MISDNILGAQQKNATQATIVGINHQCDSIHAYVDARSRLSSRLCNETNSHSIEVYGTIKSQKFKHVFNHEIKCYYSLHTNKEPKWIWVYECACIQARIQTNH